MIIGAFIFTNTQVSKLTDKLHNKNFTFFVLIYVESSILHFLFLFFVLMKIKMNFCYCYFRYSYSYS